MNTGRKIMNVAVVGCGAISDIYLENMIYTKWLLLLLRQVADVVLLTISDLSDVH